MQGQKFLFFEAGRDVTKVFGEDRKDSRGLHRTVEDQTTDPGQSNQCSTNVPICASIPGAFRFVMAQRPELLPTPPSTPTFTTRLFPSTVCLWNESKILARVMYKSKNQHRSCLYYRKLQQVMRTLKNLARLELYLQSCFETGTLVRELDGFIALCEKLKEDCGKAYSLLEVPYSDTYFMPLAVTGMALVARLNACIILLEADVEKAAEKIKCL